MRDEVIGHLRFFEEIGVAGVSRDPAWRHRPDGSGIPALGAVPGPLDEAGSNEPGSAAVAAHATRTVSGDEPACGGERLPLTEAQSRTADSLEDIRAELGDCTRCKLHTLGRRQIVFGAGNPHAELMFVGEAPGYDEDVQGIPFVGRAGQLLTKIIEAINYRRDDVYIANVIKCRPPDNRNPEPDEVRTCRPFLVRQIEAIGPRVIVALGTFAAQALLESKEPISRLRGRVYLHGGAQVVATFHPAYLLRSPDRKRDTWEDMKKVRALLQEGAV